MNNHEIDEIFNPTVNQTKIGNPSSQLYACGKNDNVELAIKGYKLVDTPSGIYLPKRIIIDSVSSASNHSAFITNEGQLYIWGSTLHGKLGIEGNSYVNVSFPTLFPLSKNNPVIQVVCGDYHTLTIFQNGEVFGWGGTLHKKLGDKSPIPSLIEGLEKVKVSKVGCGDFHSIALTENGILFSWGGGGSNFNKGQCGQGTYENIRNPKPIEFFKNKPVKDFSCGGYHTGAICINKEVYSWGSGNFGELGTGVYSDSTTPKRIQLGREIITQIACGGHHTVLLTSKGKIFSCGNNNFGQTGHKAKKNIIVPTRVYNISNKQVSQIATGWNHTLAYVAPYYVYATGLSKYGELGLGDLEMKKGFQLIEALAGKNVQKIFGGGYHSWFLMDAETPDVEYEPPEPLLNTPLGSIINEEFERTRKRKVPSLKDDPREFKIDQEEMMSDEIIIDKEEDLDELGQEPQETKEVHKIPPARNSTGKMLTTSPALYHTFNPEKNNRNSSDINYSSGKNFMFEPNYSLQGQKKDRSINNQTQLTDENPNVQTPNSKNAAKNKKEFEMEQVGNQRIQDKNPINRPATYKEISDNNKFVQKVTKQASKSDAQINPLNNQEIQKNLDRLSINDSDGESIHSDEEKKEPKRHIPNQKLKMNTQTDTPNFDYDSKNKIRNKKPIDEDYDPNYKNPYQRFSENDDAVYPKNSARSNIPRNRETEMQERTSRSRNRSDNPDTPHFRKVDQEADHLNNDLRNRKNAKPLQYQDDHLDGIPNIQLDPRNNAYNQKFRPKKKNSMEDDFDLFENDDVSNSKDYSQFTKNEIERLKDHNRWPRVQTGNKEFDQSRDENNSGQNGVNSSRNQFEQKKTKTITEKVAYSREIDRTFVDFQLFFCDLKYCHRFAVLYYKLANENPVNQKLNESLRFLHDPDPKLVALHVNKASDIYMKEHESLKLLIDNFQPDKNLICVVVMMVAIPEVYERKKIAEKFEATDFSLYSFKRSPIGDFFHMSMNDMCMDERLSLLGQWYFIMKDFLMGVCQGMRFIELRPTAYK